MNMNNINCINDDCSGCSACFFICPKDAINCSRGEKGEILYNANENCIQCGQCLNVCPMHHFKLNTKKEYFYKALTLNQEVLQKSSSGGVAYEISKFFINNNAVVYGSAWDIKKQQVIYKRVTNIDDLVTLQGSKYVQSIINKEIFNNIINDLKNGKVLFIGCPCQVSAIKKLLKIIII